ncbi:MAG: hypothetical protein LBQ09_07695 [Acidobacteriaceae bacterium]|nr:hypothetical protein [Acidobacteriaceae bacterium]
MAEEHWFDSLEQVDKYFRRSRNIVIFFSGLAIVGWGLWFVNVAVPATVIAFGAIVCTMFFWFRKDDLSRGKPLR